MDRDQWSPQDYLAAMEVVMHSHSADKLIYRNELAYEFTKKVRDSYERQPVQYD